VDWKQVFPHSNRYLDLPNGILYNGHVLDVLRQLPDESIDCVVTSPPYWGLRFYGEQANTIWGGDPNCQHEWDRTVIETDLSVSDKSKLCHGKGANPKQKSLDGKCTTGFCKKCGAWYGQLGLEPDFNLYLEHLWQIFDEIYRILKPTGTCFVNIADTYYGGGHGGKTTYETNNGAVKSLLQGASSNFVPSMKWDNSYPKKSLCFIPERFAIGMVERGWIARNVIVWEKPNALPESVKDRFTKSFEYVYFFTKRQRYYFEQLLEPYSENTRVDEIYDGNPRKNYLDHFAQNPTETKKRILQSLKQRNGRNKRNVWHINTKPLMDEHYAPYPEELPANCIKAGCPEFVCADCGRPREKILERIAKTGEVKDVRGKYVNADRLTHSPGSRKIYYTKVRRYKIPKSMQVAFVKWLKEYINGKTDLLDEVFGNYKWSHWVRIDDSGQSLPAPEDYLKLKSVLNLPDDWDKWLLETVETLVDNEGGSYREYGWSEYCSCGSSNWENGIVLDPFMGSGTTAVVAEKLNRRWIGIEINEEYCEIAKRRLKPLSNRLPLWRYAKSG